MAELPFDAEQKRTLLRQILQERGAGAAPTAAAGPSPPRAGTRGLEESAEVAAWFARMEQLGGLGLQDPCFRTLDGPAAGVASIDGRTVIDFCGYNYLGLAADPRVKEAAKDAIERYGTSASASRLASGERPLHRALERKLAGFLGVEDALVFSAGYGTNVSVLGHILTPSDLVIHDELAHNSIILGSQLSHARRVAFPHNDFRALEELLLRNRTDSGKALVVVEGAYSMDGDFPDLPSLIAVAGRHSASLFIDEAHSLGVLGRSGRGVGEHFGVDRHDVELWMGTLSKSLSSVGGYVAGSQQAHPVPQVHGAGLHLQRRAPPGQRRVGAGVARDHRAGTLARGETAGQRPPLPGTCPGRRARYRAVGRHRRGAGHRPQLRPMPPRCRAAVRRRHQRVPDDVPGRR